VISIDPSAETERRISVERRRRHFYALWLAGRAQRRRNPRRDGQRQLAGVDWYSSHWLGVAVLIVLLSGVDAILTLTLLAHGAIEANPIMAPLVEGSGRGFALWKLGMTIFGVVTLILFARVRLVGRVRVGALLYAVLALYLVLITYEWMLIDSPFH
jgi:Domain of unknown function (DUF5658)